MHFYSYAYRYFNYIFMYMHTYICIYIYLYIYVSVHTFTHPPTPTRINTPRSHMYTAQRLGRDAQFAHGIAHFSFTKYAVAIGVVRQKLFAQLCLKIHISHRVACPEEHIFFSLRFHGNYRIWRKRCTTYRCTTFPPNSVETLYNVGLHLDGVDTQKWKV